MTIAPSDRTKVTLRYEYLHDSAWPTAASRRSRAGRPTSRSTTFYGNPDAQPRQGARQPGCRRLSSIVPDGVIVRNHTLVRRTTIAAIRTSCPGAVTADKRQVALTAYNNATDRTNVFNQTDVTSTVTTGPIRHTFLAGAEFGRQLTDNFRNTGFFNNTATSILVPYDNPDDLDAGDVPAERHRRRQPPGDERRRRLRAGSGRRCPHMSRSSAGLRFDRFDLTYHNNRTGDTLERPDNLVSPRAGVVYKPIAPVSVYGSYSVSYLPSSGDQFSSLTDDHASRSSRRSSTTTRSARSGIRSRRCR